MSLLFQIKEVVQQFAEATSAALKLDVEVYDEFSRIAGTGKSKELVGNHILSNGVITRFVFGNNHLKKIIVNNPGEDEYCSLCPRRGSCMYKKAVYAAIEYEDKIVGVIGIVATNDEHVILIEYNINTMLDFVDKIANLISAKVKEHQMLKQLKTYAKFMENVIDNINKGVVILSRNHLIIDINNHLVDKLMIQKKDTTGKHILDIFPKLHLDLDIHTHTNNQYQEIVYSLPGKQIYLLCSLNPIVVNSEIEGSICLIEDYKDTTQLAYASSIKENEINLKDIIGTNIKFVKFKEKVKSVAIHDSTVLLTGETGTGKELFARSLHSENKRKNCPFIVINCGALPETLIESELFGYEKGAFTGANSMGKHGKFYMANKGTIFLDEIETMPLYLQSKLLRVIERKEIERIGGSKSIAIDVRIIAATNVPLEEMVKKGEFREDLFHRLNVVTLFIPPLRERDRDILVLAQHFIEKFSIRFNKTILGLSEAVQNIFMDYSWKGNVRELQNTIEYAINMEQSNYITVENLPMQFKEFLMIKEVMTLEDVEKNHIRKTLDRFGWSEDGRIEAAQYLGISRSTIYRKIKKFKWL
ncbi:sigma-54 interaction domain-containing protein [Clostridium sp.]|uniref:sigma-54 interaction domain-containing protein n=1 Tax=Clostridium sp. TaxID=1506 RepID=UPI003EEF418E